MIEELQKEGFRFDFSNFIEPDERDLEIARHASECGECEYDWRAASEHLEAIEDKLKPCAHDNQRLDDRMQFHCLDCGAELGR